MKINCGPTYEEKKETLLKWHRFFAIWPRRVGPNDCRMLEFIERRFGWIDADNRPQNPHFRAIIKE